ncbi:virulence-associated E family protein [Novosphingobium flavum]|uniref:Virulence-associated E family protein n=1 Tax=Novosphingobium flavum TaxID=1778672 RepID=A0A7X1KLY3_9SPHN|nr:VapE domain-containing protein [Novosphingobium flavum]MBC2666057.1 virulence-associated E family protein [Novosphingobium flavum]
MPDLPEAESEPAPPDNFAKIPPPPPTNPRRLDSASFPDGPAPGSSSLPLTIDNVEHLLDRSGISVRFNVLKKRPELRWRDGRPATVNDIISLANINRLNGSNWLLQFFHDVAMRHPTNPVADWIGSVPWDGQDRLPAFYATVETADGYPSYLKPLLLHRWLLSATAAALLQGRRFHARGVLTLQGPQGIGKTTWIANLVPAGPLRNELVKRDHHLDGSNKDSILGAIAHWIVEIGELDSTFRKDVARLKGFLTSDCDKVRPPYARSEMEYDRRTVFAATVNDEAFLVDHTGNSRFWTIAVERLDYDHTIDMQQVFAQLKVEFEAGGQWWLKPSEEESLTRYNLRHRAISAIRERVLDHIDVEAGKDGGGTYMTASQLLRDLGINYPSNAQAKECGATLRETLGAPSRVQGRDQWRITIRDGGSPYARGS